ncbi:MAG: hypothetical protein ACREBR_05805 [bacterium]
MLVKGFRKQFCKHGHDILIVGRDKHGSCNQCILDYHKTPEYKVYQKNYNIQYANDHEEELQEYKQEYYKTNKEDIQIQRKSYQEQYYKNNIEKFQKYARDNHQAILEYHKLYYNEHQTELINKQREYYRENSSVIKSKNKEYEKLHPEIYKLAALRKHSKRKLRIPQFGQDGILEFYGDCLIGYEVDHIIPLCGKLVSGLHVIGNLQYLTELENNKKNNKCNLLEVSDLYGKILEQEGLK